MAYKPVTFDPLPVQRYSDRTNMTNAQAPQALKLDANFAKLNAELTKLPTYAATLARSASGVAGPMTSDGNYHNFPTATWAPLTFTVPDCSAVMATVGARANNPGAGGVFIVAAASGNAFLQTQSAAALRIFITPATGACSAARLWIVGTEIKTGLTITLQPQYMIPSGAGVAMAYGGIMLTAVS